LPVRSARFTSCEPKRFHRLHFLAGEGFVEVDTVSVVAFDEDFIAALDLLLNRREAK